MHLVGILYLHVNDDARSKPLKVTIQFSGLQAIRNTTQYKRTTVGVAVQQYAVVHCDIDRKDGSLMLPSYTVIHLYLATCVTRKIHELTIRN